jgi:ring-1,2-phenylacetyl-CoA epoxidase subunit PaaE
MSSNAIEIVGETTTSATHFYPLAVASIRRETRDAVAVTFNVPDRLKDRFRFVQGQFVTLKAVINGEEVRRSYSICSAVQDATLRVGIKRAPGGLFSNWVLDYLRPGDVLEVAPPEGRFHLPLSPENKKSYVAFAAGSGITPVLSILKTTLLAEPNSSFTLFYANRASSSIMFREELAELKDRFLGRFNLVHVMTREHQDAQMLNGRIDPEKAEQLMRTFCNVDAIDAVFLCGPHAMVEAIKPRLTEMGIAESRIRIELFVTQTNGRNFRRAASFESSRECHVTLLLDGARHSFAMNRDESVLDAALEHDIDVRHSCKSGVCATCRAKLVAGQVEMDANYALEDYEIARGFILTCQSFPVTDEITVDYDQDN